MNCVLHHADAAVGSCGGCGGGVCALCFERVEKLDGKPYCPLCVQQMLNAEYAELRGQIPVIRKQKIVWSAIFVVGLLVFVLGLSKFHSTPMAYVGILIWAAAGWGERARNWAVARSQMSAADVMREELGRMSATRTSEGALGYYGVILVVKLIKWIILGCIFPFRYVYFMVVASGNLKKSLHQYEELLANWAAGIEKLKNKEV